MFGEKNSAAIYLERNNLIYVHPEKQIKEQLTLDTSIINHLEIKNDEKFVQTVKVFLEQFPQDLTVIYLSKPIIFEREIDTTEETSEVLSPVDKFLSMVPIAKSKLGSKVLVGESSTLCLATNREYYELVIKSAELAGIKISFVVPAFMFNGLEDSNGIVVEMVDAGLNEKEILLNTNFIDKNTGAVIDETSDKMQSSEESISESSRSRTKTLVLSLILVGLLSFSLIFSYVNGLFDRFLPTKVSDVTSSQVIPSVTDLTIATQSAQPSPSPVAFSNLRASIKNGTGIAGQAARAKDLLDQLKLQEVIIASDSARGTTTTMLEYDPIVPEQLVLEVKSKLETIFSDVEPKEATNTGEFDFLVTTGTE